MSTLGNTRIAPAEGKLGVLIPGIGAVSTTFMAGVEAVKRGLGQPIGSLTQLGTVRLGKRTEGRSPMIKDFVPLAGLNDLVFGGWDIFNDTAYESAAHAAVGVGIGIGVGPGYVAGPPVCEYGYYSYAPYACAPYGYYGASWFANGIFIGAGPWYHGGWGRGYYGRGYYGGRGYAGRGFEGRGFAGRGFEGRPAAGFHGAAPRGESRGGGVSRAARYRP